ncbi:nucleotidyltransferase family protein [Colwellia sp. D2M02]|uniref:nucleotidyltransferase family protein n=1 Tax=Colwellia sp. D2M02 TaxID=2841562 RepID=UPI001C08E29C|nr:nucleotidyltransferase family protein [Colwellia sp. D2M02]MBU2895036.1 nucleotidyltransferase family protein [Colwellia sp. D2M02]
MPVNIILLAAGAGKRFAGSKNSKGDIKQLAKFQGATLIEHTIEQLNPALAQLNQLNQTTVHNDDNANHTSDNNEKSQLYISLGAHQDKISPLLPKNTPLLTSRHWQKGIGHSLADAIKQVAPFSSHLLIALVDQPLVTQQHYQTLVNTSLLHPDKIIATRSDDLLLPPVIFPKDFFPELVQLQGDIGAAKLLKRHKNRVISLQCDMAKLDVDTPEQLAEMNNIATEKITATREHLVIST